MKKRYLILAGLLVMTVAAAGCGRGSARADAEDS
jgi:hypothetical protein